MKHTVLRTAAALLILASVMTWMTFGILGCGRGQEDSDGSGTESSTAGDSSDSREESQPNSQNSPEHSRQEISSEELSFEESSEESDSSMEESSEEEYQPVIDYNTKYLVRVNKSTNVITVYAKDANGNHTIPVRAMICSTGYDTPEGVFMMGYHARWNGLNGDTWGQYVSHITGNFLFHTVPALWRGEDGVYAYYYNQLGTT